MAAKLNYFKESGFHAQRFYSVGKTKLALACYFLRTGQRPPLGDEASPFETEITGPTDGRCAHNHVIQHLDLQESGAIEKSAS
jgi:hypothetical protein